MTRTIALDYGMNSNHLMSSLYGYVPDPVSLLLFLSRSLPPSLPSLLLFPSRSHPLSISLPPSTPPSLTQELIIITWTLLWSGIPRNIELTMYVCMHAKAVFVLGAPLLLKPSVSNNDTRILEAPAPSAKLTVHDNQILYLPVSHCPSPTLSYHPASPNVRNSQLYGRIGRKESVWVCTLWEGQPTL